MLNLDRRAQKLLNKTLAECSDQEIYKLLLDVIQEKSQALPV